MNTPQDNNPPPVDPADNARQLFRYIGGEEWREYRAIMAVFAGTFFAEFAPEDVVDALRESAADIDPDVIPDRLESLRRWGNLAASTTVGNPASLDDYYRRRHRYLITRAGQEVYDVVEGVLHGIDEVGDVQAGRLRDLHRALQYLQSLIEQGLATLQPEQIADAVRGVFDPHESFSTEITQFFASINQWQSRFDLEPHEISFFAEVLVGYVSEQLVEIERMARPIAISLRELDAHLNDIVKYARSGLAARVDDAGLAQSITVRYASGTTREDWDHLRSWFGASANERSRLDALTRQALAAVRTLTGNLTRLSRIGAGGASRRGDFIRLAQFIDEADDINQVHDLVTAAFGLFPARHFGVLAADADDPVATTTPWESAPRANVPVTLRERGDRIQRGNASPMRDRELERAVLRHKRQEERAAESVIAKELLDSADSDGRVEQVAVSTRALRRLRLLLGASSARRRAGSTERVAQDRDLHCRVVTAKHSTAVITCPEGELTILDTQIYLHAAQTKLDSLHEPKPVAAAESSVTGMSLDA